MNAQRHQIQRQIFDITVPDRSTGLRLHDELARIQAQGIEELIDRCCTELSAPDRVHRLGRVEVDLGEISLEGLESELITKLYPVLREALAAKIREEEELCAMIGEDPASSASLELISLFARTGAVPFWADVARPDAVDEAVAKLFARSPEALVKLARELASDERALHRLTRHIKAERLRALFESLVEAEGPRAKARAAELWELIAIARTTSPPPGSATLWVAALRTACRGENRGRDAIAFFREALGRASIESGIAYRTLVMALRAASGAEPGRTTRGFGSVAEALATELSGGGRDSATKAIELPSDGDWGAETGAELGAGADSAATSSVDAYGRASTRASHADERGADRSEASRADGVTAPTPQGAVREDKNIPPGARPTAPGDKNIPREHPNAAPDKKKIPEGRLDTFPEDRNIPQGGLDALPDDKNIPKGTSGAALDEKNIPQGHLGAPPDEKNIPKGHLDAPRDTPNIPQRLIGAPRGETMGDASGPKAELGPPERRSARSERPLELPFPPNAAAEPPKASEAAARRAAADQEHARAARPNEPRPQRSARAPAANEDPDAVYLDTAGLVLFWPFLARFFDRLELLTEKKAFVDRAARGRAVLLLQRLATLDPEPAEYRLPLAKVLCGMPLDEVFDRGPELRDVEIKESVDLVAAMLDHAKNFGRITPEGLREGFLLRRGVLSAKGDAWLLRVERAPYDVVLNQLPWPITWVRLPWMEAALAVEWIR